MPLRRSRWQIGLVILSGALMLATPASCSVADSPVVVQAGARLDGEELQPLLNADVVYLGEHHDRPADHAAQMEIIEALYAEHPDMAIALEMFQRPFQTVIDQYLAGEISEAELVEQSEYEQRWGFPWEYYAPMLRFAKEKQLPVLALNAPSEVVRQVAQSGLTRLSEDDLRYIPPLSDIDITNRDYQTFVREAFGSHGSHGNFNFDNFFAAQVVWDETMAEAIANFKQTSPDTLVVVLAGTGHVIYGYGIPDRVDRRLDGSVDQIKVLLNMPSEALPNPADGVADVLWYSE